MNKDFPETGASGVPPGHENDPPNSEAPTVLQTAPAVPKNRGGAPRGARNGRALALLTAKGTARERRDKFQRSAERLVREALVSAGLEAHPLAKLIGKNLVRLEGAAQRCEERATLRGWFNAKGHPAPAFEKLVEIVGSQLGEFRRMLEALTPQGAERRVVVTIVDDVNAPDGSMFIPQDVRDAHAAQQREPGPALGPRCEELTLAARLANREIALPDEAAIAARLQDLDEDPDDSPQAARATRQPSPVTDRRAGTGTTPKAPPAAPAPGSVEPAAPPQTLLEQFEDADRRMREHFDSGGSFGGLGRLF